MLTNPTPEQKRIAIAEACGWKFIPSHDRIGPGMEFIAIAISESWVHDEHETVWDIKELPDYLNDLNAMHEAETVLIRTDGDEYVRRLKSLRGEEWGFASAEERAEAFGLTLKLWEYAPTEKEK